jgi:hypothetical protein
MKNKNKPPCSIEPAWRLKPNLCRQGKAKRIVIVVAENLA